MLPREFRLIKRRNFLALASAGVLRAAADDYATRRLTGGLPDSERHPLRRTAIVDSHLCARRQATDHFRQSSSFTADW